MLHGELGKRSEGTIKSTQCLENAISEERVTDVELSSKDKESLGNNVVTIVRMLPALTQHGDPLVPLSPEEAGPDVESEHGNLQTEMTPQKALE